MKVQLLIQKSRVTLYSFLLVVILLSLSRHLFIISLWPWIFFWIIEGRFKEKFQGGLFHKSTLSFWVLSILFIVYLTSLLWSKNISYGLKNIGEMATMIIIPFILTFSTNDFKRRDNLTLILKAFIFGLLISSLYLLIVALTKSLSFEDGKLLFHPAINDWESDFYNNNFTFLIHPSYYSLMLIMAVAVCLNDLQSRLLFKQRIFIPVLLSVYFAGIVFLTQSRAAFFALFAVALFYLLIYRIHYRYKIIAFMVIITFSLLYLGNAFRFKALRANLSFSSSAGSTLLHTNIRYRIWKSAVNIVKEKPLFGVGIGDEQDALNKSYQENDYSKAFDEHLNCHNQFLQTGLSVGITGLIILLFILFYPLTMRGFGLRSYYISFLLIVFVMFFFESMFERVLGVAFFSIFYVLLTGRVGINKDVE